MKLSTRGRYGTRLMLELAKSYGDGPVSMSQISKSQNIPIKYLEQLIIPLKKADLVHSVRGPKGGHMLAKPPDEIHIWDVLTLLESKYFLVDCVDNPQGCENSSSCPIRHVWSQAYRSMVRIFLNTSLKDILEFHRADSLK